MSTGTLESIAQSLAVIAAHMQASGTLARQPESDPQDDESDDDQDAAAAKKSAAKKPAAKKTAAKKTAVKAKAKAGPDLSDITNFKKALFDAAEASGLEDVMVRLKKFIKAEGYGSSDEVAVDDREAFLSDVKTHFQELADEAQSDDALAGL